MSLISNDINRKLLMLRQTLQNIRYPRSSRHAEDSLRQLYEGLLPPLEHNNNNNNNNNNNISVLDYDGRLLVRTLATEGAIDTIIESMTLNNNNHHNRPQLYHRACGVLSLFAQEEANLIVEKGGYDTILFIMEQFKDLEYIQQACIVVLVELTRGTTIHFDGTKANDVVSKIVQAMEQHKYSARIYYLSSRAMRVSCFAGINVGEDLARTVQRNLLDGIILFHNDIHSQEAGRDALQMWVGQETSKRMIEQTAMALLTLEDIIVRALPAIKENYTNNNNNDRNVDTSNTSNRNRNGTVNSNDNSNDNNTSPQTKRQKQRE